MGWNQWIRTVEIVPAVSRAQPAALAGQAEALLRTGCRIFSVRVGEDLGALSTVRSLAPLARRYDGVISVQVDGPAGPAVFAAVAEAGGSSVTVQLESVPDVTAALESARTLGLAAGVAISEAPDLETAALAAAGADLVRCPGTELYEQLRNVRLLSRLLPAGMPIQVGGGVSHENVRELYEAGARVLVVGTAIFEREDLPRAYRRLIQALA
jgi:thiamine monophosphate synthase